MEKVWLKKNQYTITIRKLYMLHMLNMSLWLQTVHQETH